MALCDRLLEVRLDGPQHSAARPPEGSMQGPGKASTSQVLAPTKRKDPLSTVLCQLCLFADLRLFRHSRFLVWDYPVWCGCVWSTLTAMQCLREHAWMFGLILSRRGVKAFCVGAAGAGLGQDACCGGPKGQRWWLGAAAGGPAPGEPQRGCKPHH